MTVSCQICEGQTPPPGLDTEGGSVFLSGRRPKNYWSTAAR